MPVLNFRSVRSLGPNLPEDIDLVCFLLPSRRSRKRCFRSWYITRPEQLGQRAAEKVACNHAEECSRKQAASGCIAPDTEHIREPVSTRNGDGGTQKNRRSLVYFPIKTPHGWENHRSYGQCQIDTVASMTHGKLHTAKMRRSFSNLVADSGKCQHQHASQFSADESGECRQDEQDARSSQRQNPAARRPSLCRLDNHHLNGGFILSTAKVLDLEPLVAISC